MEASLNSLQRVKTSSYPACTAQESLESLDIILDRTAVGLRRWVTWAWPSILLRTLLIATIKPTGTS